MITDLNKETRSTVGDMIKDGKAFLTKAGKTPRQTLNGVLDDGKARIDDLREDTRSRMAALKAETRSLIDGIGKDAQLVVDEVVDGGREVLDKVPGKRKIEKAVRLRIRTLPAQFNLPSKKDIDGLARRVGRLNKKVDALHRAVSLPNTHFITIQFFANSTRRRSCGSSKPMPTVDFTTPSTKGT
jgi:polyhydroxyalkanoate synthesis regulator phasin